MMNELAVDPEFQKLIVPLSAAEKSLLRESLLNKGCCEPICIWNNIIIDGHNRYEICTANHIPYITKSFFFESRNEVIIWICAAQLGRKDITEETRKYLIGKRYEAERNIEIKNNDGKNQYPDDIVQNEQLITANTAHKLGYEYHLSHNTVLKYGSYARALDRLSEAAPKLTTRILSGSIKVSYENVVRLSQLPQNELIALSEQLSKQSNVFIRYSDTRNAMAGRPITPVPMSVTPVISVKDMPEYDPDAEISSLKLTIPSWISTIKRVKSVTKRSEISESAKRQLTTALQQLNDCTVEMLLFLEE